MANMGKMIGDVNVMRNPSLRNSLDVILGEWEAIKETGHNVLPPDELTQRALAWRRIRAVLGELSTWKIDIQSIEVNPVVITIPDHGQDHEKPPGALPHDRILGLTDLRGPASVVQPGTSA